MEAQEGSGELSLDRFLFESLHATGETLARPLPGANYVLSHEVEAWTGTVLPSNCISQVT